MPVSIPGAHGKPGVCYALNDEGVELPVIDVTHAAFAIEISEAELDEQLKRHVREIEQRSRVPAFIQNFVLGFMLKRSRLMRVLMSLDGGFLGGMDTYILKLGPRNMDNRIASSIDRQISASLPGLSMRLRIQQVAHLLADGLLPALAAHPESPLHLLNIGGGPAIDSLNALIILQKEHPGLLSGRAAFIHVLDLDEQGPRFGARALAALQAEGAPLHGLQIGFERVAYDWTDASILVALLADLRDTPAIISASSEGALFEYGSDEVIASNLKALQEGTPAEAVVIGSVTRADTTGRLLNTSSRAALQLRGVEAFTDLARGAGWVLARRLDRPSGHDVCLRKAASPG